MLIKFAAAKVLDARVAREGSALVKDAHRHEFDYDPQPGFLYVRSRAISSRTNDNFDHFPADEIRQAYSSFIGKPVFVNHHNENHRRARGVIVDAVIHEDRNSDGSEDTWVEVLMEVDAVRFPKLAQAIMAGEIDRTSMGTDVEFSVCSVCENRATTPLEYCKHIPAMKGMKVQRTTASGTKEEVLVYEKCYGLRFFENSLLVEEPADPTAYFLGVDDRGLAGMSASTTEANYVSTPKTAAALRRHIEHSGRWQRTAQRRRAIGETVVPPEVDTLRDETCPVCGEADSFDGDQCQVCEYVRPPEEFLDPDTDKAKQVDLRQEEEATAIDPDEEVERKAEEGEMLPGEEEPGEVDAEFGEEFGDEDDDQSEGEDESDDAPPFEEESDAEDGEEDDDTSDDGDDEEDEDEEDDEEGSNAPPWLKDRKKKSRLGGRGTTGGTTMGPTLRALAAQDREIKALKRQNAALLQGFKLIAQAAGIDRHPRVTAVLKAAEMDENPGSTGWASEESGQEAPADTSDNARGKGDNETPEGGLSDDPRDVGNSSESDASPDAQTDLEGGDTVLDEPLDLNEQDVTAPVAGTDDLGEGPRGQPGSGRTETDVRVTEETQDTAFSLEEGGWDTSATKDNRVIAALRLARLRIAAGIAETQDDLGLSTKIAGSKMSDEDIQHEIGVLSQVTKAAGKSNGGGQPVPRNLVPRAASQARRTVPSLVGGGEPQIPTQTVASAPSDEEFLFD